MKGIIALLILLMSVSCGIVEIGGADEDEIYPPAWVSPSYGGGTPQDRHVCYITALDYPEGYDWISDRETGTVKCSLVVFAGGKPVMKVPVGEEYLVSGEPDMHRVVGGHLYTDYSTDSQTVFKCDAEEVFRYDGCEMICDMAIRDGDIYTLGQRRDGNGFSFRRNGEVLLERHRGYVFGRIQHIGDSLCFAFSEPVESAEGRVERYYHVIDGKVSQVALREDIRYVWDIVMHEGKVHLLARLVGINAPVLVAGEEVSVLKLSGGAAVSSCRFLPSEKDLFMEGTVSFSAGTETSLLWRKTEIYQSFYGMTVSAMCSWGDGICCLLPPSSASAKTGIFRCGDVFESPEGYLPVGTSPLAMVDGILHVGLSSLAGKPPVVWMDGQLDTLDVNGYICTVNSVLP